MSATAKNDKTEQLDCILISPNVLYPGLLEKPDELRRSLELHVIDEKTYAVLAEMGIPGDRLCRQGDGTYILDDATPGKPGKGIRLPGGPLEAHRIFFLQKNPHGSHRFGGEKPADLLLPHPDNMKTDFVYLGYIDGTDPRFAWIGVDRLPLIWPLFECNLGIYLDWTNPKAPKVLNPETFMPAWFNNKMAGWEQVAFQETPCLATEDIDAKSYANALPLSDIRKSIVAKCGIPVWQQDAKLPVCPRTGETLRFVCGIESDTVPVLPGREGRNLVCTSYGLMSIGDGGALYVFWHPRSRVMYMIAQW